METLINGGAAAPGGAGADIIKDSTTATFMADVVEASTTVPVIVDFWAPWCGPCKTLGPVIEKVVREAAGTVRLVKVDIDQNPANAGAIDSGGVCVQGRPTGRWFRRRRT